MMFEADQFYTIILGAGFNPLLFFNPDYALDL
jgi:hypothetical protein